MLVCLLLNAASKFRQLISFGIFNSFVIIADFVLVMTWFASMVVALEKIVSRRCPGTNFEFSCCFRRGSAKAGGGAGAAGEGGGGTRPTRPPERRATAFMRNQLSHTLYFLRWPLVVLTLGVAIDRFSNVTVPLWAVYFTVHQNVIRICTGADSVRERAESVEWTRQ